MKTNKTDLIKKIQSLRYWGIVPQNNKIAEIWRGKDIKITYPVNFRR